MIGLSLLLGVALLAPPSEGDEELSSSAIFNALFMHLEPHAVAALWWGGDEGLGRVPPFPTDQAGQALSLDGHGHPVPFASPAAFEAFYRKRHGGGSGVLIYNINTVQWIAGGGLILLMLWAGLRARRLRDGAPRGRAYNVLESLVLFVRDDLVYATMGAEAGRRFLPLFLTQFFFILFMNILGLVPDVGRTGLLGTATANLAVTGGMALTTLLWVHLSGMREHGIARHWANFLPQGLPVFVLPIIIPVELIGMLVKPFALMIRLFANMLAGHLVILSFFGLAYLFANWFIAVPLLGMAIAISCLELFVGFVQAYVFTYLSVIFVGATVHPEH